MTELYHGVKITTEHETINLDYISDIWNLFNWDMNDPNAKECSNLITKELICFGHIDLTKANNGKKLFVELLPPQN